MRPEATPAPVAITPVLLRPDQAAEALGISPRMLRSITAPHGSLPVVRLGRRCVRYRVRDLEAWAAERSEPVCTMARR